MMLLPAAFAQNNVNQPANTYSLEDCIRIALETNPQVKQAELQVQSDNNIYQQSKWQRFPSVSFSAGQGFSFGFFPNFGGMYVHCKLPFRRSDLSWMPLV
ncbi:hypothetical protein FEM33_01500 [Dyadobacter flavalbus]|uniref:TolC family protein n=2 Tax=Dyadobacter flavalbus TaxID=2579942 RepID=A0A5M8QZQ2_9BACT|nr:hypothetical protein FEM33_01500 [Dyadobacter flavalbus]